jgi:hypothetical protein
MRVALLLRAIVGALVALAVVAVGWNQLCSSPELLKAVATQAAVILVLTRQRFPYGQSIPPTLGW